MNPEERRQFVRDHRTAIFGYNRAKDGPAMSIVFYSIDEEWPSTYLQVYCDATIETGFDAVVDVMMRIAGVMAGQPMSEDVRPMVEEGARVEKRVAVRLRPYATFYTPPRHVHSEADINPGLLHSTSASVPW